MAGDPSAKETDLTEPGLAQLFGQGDPISDLQPLYDPTTPFPHGVYLMHKGSV
ncbi:Rho Gtpase-Activating Protein 22 [Manis pentadactyla]|nr:Rho Gtpase-Activating Protein 22 [Manis pentadactyla]